MTYMMIVCWRETRSWFTLIEVVVNGRYKPETTFRHSVATKLLV
jgi:hypothetical protein